DRLRLATGDGYAEDAAAAVDDQRAAVTEPVGRFDARGRDVDDAAVRRGDRLRFECAVQHRLPRRGRQSRVQVHVGEHRLFRHVLVVRTNAEADVERLLKRQAHRRAGKVQLLTLRGQVQEDIFAPLLEAQPLRGRDVRLHLVRGGAGGLAELQRGQAV